MVSGVLANTARHSAPPSGSVIERRMTDVSHEPHVYRSAAGIAPQCVPTGPSATAHGHSSTAHCHRRAAYGDKDLDELCSTLASLENAVVVLGSVFELERSKLKTGKRAQKLIAECKKLGFVEELSKPKPYELKMMLIERAKAQDTTLPEGAAAALLERCGEDPFLLENEVDKLCALSGYQTVTAAMVAEMGTVSLEADVFEMIRMITAKNATGACKKLQTLLRLQQEPIAITGAMIGSYVDLYRVKLGASKRKSYAAVFKDFGYKGSDYRLKRSAETASHYTLGQLETCLQVLLDLDKSLKSQPVDVQTLLEAALCRLALAGSGR